MSTTKAFTTIDKLWIIQAVEGCWLVSHPLSAHGGGRVADVTVPTYAEAVAYARGFQMGRAA